MGDSGCPRLSDEFLVRRIGLTAAGLLATLALALSLATSSRAKAPLSHTCSLTDRQFVETAKTNMAALGLWGQQYLNGDAKADEVVAEANRAEKIVGATSPTDPSLSQTRALMVAMFGEYARAIHAQAHQGDAGKHMFRAYGLANFAHNVLESASAPLRAKGCDVRPLL